MNILIRGGGDVASGVALRLYRAGLNVVITELAQPLAVRRSVAFSEAIYEGEWTVEGVVAKRVDSATDAMELLRERVIPILVAPELDSVGIEYTVLVDGRLTKSPANYSLTKERLIIGLGPGFTAGQNCHAVVETNRGHTLGRVYWQGTALADTSHPEGDARRVLRSPAEGTLSALAEIGQHVESGQSVAVVAGQNIVSPFQGIVRGMIRPGINVSKGLKIGDIDARDDPALCHLVSDKALAVGGGVLEAILARAK